MIDTNNKNGCNPKILKILFTVKDLIINKNIKIHQFFAISSLEQFNSFMELINHIRT